jgi:hypothetical protein
MRDPNYRSDKVEVPAPVAPATADITRDRVAFTRLVRNELFSFLRLLANKNYQELDALYSLEQLFPEAQWKYSAFEAAMVDYYESHAWIRLDPGARAKSHTRIKESDDRSIWTIEQTLVDPEELNDLQIVFECSLSEAKASSRVTLVPIAIERIVL